MDKLKHIISWASEPAKWNNNDKYFVLTIIWISIITDVLEFIYA